jgi:hypothetical protein
MSADSARGDAIDMDLLVPLDGFVASVDTLAKAASVPTSDAARADLSAAHRRAHRAAVALDAAVLAALDSVLEDRADEIAGQRRSAMLAALVAILGGVCLLWAGMPGPAGGPAGGPGAPATAAPTGVPGAQRPGGHGDTTAASDTAADLISARDLHELAQSGQGRTRRRRDHDDPR